LDFFLYVTFFLCVRFEICKKVSKEKEDDLIDEILEGVVIPKNKGI